MTGEKETEKQYEKMRRDLLEELADLRAGRDVLNQREELIEKVLLRLRELDREERLQKWSRTKIAEILSSNITYRDIDYFDKQSCTYLSFIDRAACALFKAIFLEDEEKRIK